MADSKQRKNIKNNGFNSAAMAVGGAVVGLGIAAAGLVLREEKNREKIKESLSDTKDHVVELMEDKRKDIEDTANKIEKKRDQNNKKLKKIADVTKES